MRIDRERRTPATISSAVSGVVAGVPPAIAGSAGDTPATTPLSRADPRSLSRQQLWLRAAPLVAFGVAAIGLRALNPENVPSLLFQTSCGAATGLPCLFCGTTRALHHLLNGDFSQALYFNWLAFPASGLALGLAALFGTELALRRRLSVVWPSFQFTPRVAAIGGVALVLLWVLQVSLAVSQRKTELLNAAGPLYSLFLK
jgi:hypothetical protein